MKLVHALRQLGLIAVGGVLACGCETQGTTDPGTTPGPKPAATASDAQTMCREHGVLEAICTRCNPKLIPVFQAKGDWCAEHQLPESVCPVCHPERGGKPQAAVERDEVPADRTPVKFRRPAAAAAAGIETVRATAQPNDTALTVPFKTVYDATRVAHLNARAPGVVRQLHVDIGAKVTRGTPLLTIDSPEIGGERARLAGARERLELAQQNLQRVSGLADAGITPAKNLLAARQELVTAESEYEALRASLAARGGATGSAGTYALTSPLSGVVTQRNAAVGKLVDSDQLLFEIVDTSKLWAELDIPESALPQVRPDQPVTLVLDGAPERRIDGTLSYVAPSIEAATRTAKARVALDNPDGTLRANMFGRAALAVAGPADAVVIPRAALQRVKDVQLAFVRRAEGHYELRRLRTTGAPGDRVFVTSGIAPGEEVVTTGSFLLKTELLKDRIGSGCCEGD